MTLSRRRSSRKHFKETRLIKGLMFIVMCLLAVLTMLMLLTQDQKDHPSSGKQPFDTEGHTHEENKAIPGKVQGEVHRAKRATRDYSATVCESSLGGVCRRNDLTCEGEFVGGAACSLGLGGGSLSKPKVYHECCVADSFVPTDQQGNPVTGSPIDIADATAQVFNNAEISLPGNCGNVSDSSCPFWSGGLKENTVNGILDFLSASGCKGKQLDITAGAELSHTTIDFGPGITAQNGYVLRINTQGSCYQKYVEENFAIYLSLPDCYQDTDGNLYHQLDSLYHQLDSKGRVWDVAFIPEL